MAARKFVLQILLQFLPEILSKFLFNLNIQYRGYNYLILSEERSKTLTKEIFKE